MKFKSIIKKCISLMLLFTMLANCDLPCIANAATNGVAIITNGIFIHLKDIGACS